MPAIVAFGSMTEADTRQAYVLGFPFDDTGTRVALIQKNKPDWQCGKLNGVGGKIEAGETPGQAMTREFHEETGVLGVDGWYPFAIMEGPKWLVHCFRLFDSVVLNTVRTTEAELVVIANPKKLPEQVLYNLRWLIPLATDPDALVITRVEYEVKK